MPSDALANIYAKSLFELAEQAGGPEKIAEIGSELETICELSRSERSFREFLASPLIARTARSESLKRIFSNRVTDITLRFLLVLNDKGRLAHLEQINAALDRMVQESYGRVEVDVFTPSRLDEAQLATLRSRIHSALGKEPVLHPYTDRSMIGGIKLRIGDQLIDGSIASRLRRLRQGLNTAGGTVLRDRMRRVLGGGGESEES